MYLMMKKGNENDGAGVRDQSTEEVGCVQC